MSELVYLLYWFHGELKMKKGRLGLNFVPDLPEGEKGYPYHTKVPMRLMKIEHGKIVCREEDIPKATEMMIKDRECRRKEVIEKYFSNCADCKFFEPIDGGRGHCIAKFQGCNHPVYYRSDKACTQFIKSDNPSTQYLRTKYDGSLHCPCCKRNFNWSDSLRRAYNSEPIFHYLPDRPMNLTIRVFYKTCTHCGSDFKFFYDKLNDEYKYFITHYRRNDTSEKEEQMGPEELNLDLKLYYAPKDLITPKVKEIKFNGPATIIFWEDGDKTVVKHDGKGRKDKRLGVLYAYIKKIYGPGKEYHQVLEQIEEVLK